MSVLESLKVITIDVPEDFDGTVLADRDGRPKVRKWAICDSSKPLSSLRLVFDDKLSADLALRTIRELGDDWTARVWVKPKGTAA